MKKFSQYLIPSVISSICMSMYAIIDGIFIGFKLSDLGLAAINLAWPITAVLQSLGVGIGISSAIYIQRLLAKGRIDDSNKSKLSALLYLLITGLLAGGILFLLKEPILVLFKAEGETLKNALDYTRVILFGSIFQVMGLGILPLLKNSGKIHTAFWASFTAIAVNLILDYVLIFPLEMGLKGAAIASVMAQVGAFLVCFVSYFKELKGINLSLECLKEITLGMLAPFILNYSYSFIIIITNALCITYGGAEAVAAYTMLSYILCIISASAQGTADAIQPLFSFHYELKEYNKCHRMLAKCALISFTLVFVIGGVILLLTNPLVMMYNLSAKAKEIYLKAIPYYFSGFILISVIKVVASYFYSINHKLFANILIIAEPFIITPVIYLAFSSLKLDGIWISFLVIQAIMFTIGLSLIIIEMKEKIHHAWFSNN